QNNPDIEKILWADGKVEILSSKIIKDKILVNGLVKFEVAYKSNEEELNICLLETNKDFREEIEIEGITEDMVGEIKSNLEYIEYKIMDERKISLNALINISGKVEQVNLVEIVKDIKGGSDLQILKEKIQYNDIKGRDESYALIKEVFELEEDQPSIEKILKIQISAYEKEYSVSYDRIIISGTIESSIIYFGGGKLNSIKKEIPFTHFMEMENIEEDFKYQINMEVVDGQYELRENLEGEFKIIDLEVKVKVLCKSYNIEEKEAVIDVYSTSREVDLQKEEINIIENIKDIVISEEVFKEISSKGFKEIYALETNSHIINSQYVEDKIILEGILPISIYYLEEDTEEIITLKEEIPFKSYISIEELENYSIMPIINVETSIEELKYNLKNDILNIEGKVKNHVSIDIERKINILTEIEETEVLIDKKNKPSIIIYMVQKDDKLWDIAKRYNTTMEEIILSNDIKDPSSLMPGEKIIIEKKVDIQF
ncbi:MAG: DUF3794 domain-containing protein, partial [Tissierellia bacterium]|nr:DUF3794 domain-containing protein [Tissierellia bacterium]